MVSPRQPKVAAMQDMYDIAIITAIYDNYDTLKPPIAQNGNRVQWVCVTDNYGLVDNNNGWTVMYQPRPKLHPNRAAKYPKMRPFDYTTARKSVWIDASFRVTSPEFARDMLDILDICDIAQFKHPWRDCVYHEADETLKLSRYADVHELIPAQMRKYREMLSHPDKWGLWATGVIARRHTEAIELFGEMWLSENLGHSYQDQLSEAPILRFLGGRPTSLPGTHFVNNWLSYEASGRHA